MEITKRREQGIDILDIAGKIIMGEKTFQVRDTVLELLNLGQKKIMLNLGEVSYVDSSGIGELVSTRNEVIKNGGKIAFFNPSKRVIQILEMTKLDSILNLHHTETEARASVS